MESQPIGNKCIRKAYTMHDSMGRQQLYAYEEHEPGPCMMENKVSGAVIRVYACMNCGCLFAKVENENENQ